MNLKKVIVAKDNDGHWYVIPLELKGEFFTLLELSETNYHAEDNFIDKFGHYMTGGDLNLVQLYAEI